MSLPAFPSAASITTPEQIAEAGAALVAWAENADDPTAVKETADKWAAITEYLRRQSIEGVAQAEATLRRLELRISVLLPDAVPGSHASAVAGVNRHERDWFRQMGAHPDIVEQVIAESTDRDPASRRKVLRAIENADAIADAIADAKVRNKALRESGYDPTDQNRRTPILHALVGVIDAADRLEEVATPSDVEWTLATSKHLGVSMRAKFQRALAAFAKYGESS